MRIAAGSARCVSPSTRMCSGTSCMVECDTTHGTKESGLNPQLRQVLFEGENCSGDENVCSYLFQYVLRPSSSSYFGFNSRE